jgi:HSP20 family molecular chaperone IbpA
LSYDVDVEKVQAECREGILRVFLPWPEAEKPRRIRISKG